MRTVVIAGASVAGVTTARQLRANGYADRIVLVSGEEHTPYDRPPLTKGYLMAESETEPPTLVDPSWYDGERVELRLANPVVGLDHERGRISLSDGEEVDYDELVVATGCTPNTLTVPGLGALPTVSTLEDSRALRAHLRARRHLVIVGAGFVALEVAAVASSRGVGVTVLAPDRCAALRSLDRATADYVLDRHAARGVRFAFGRSIANGVPCGEGSRLTLDDGEVIEDAVAIAAIGSSPNVSWLGSSTRLGACPDNGIRCDAWGRTGVRGIYAVGDISLPHSPRLGRHVRVRHWTHAVNQAATVARTIAGAEHPGHDAVPYFWSDQAELGIRYSGDLATIEVLYEDLDERGRVAVYGSDGIVTGVVAINRPVDFVRHQRRIGAPL